MAVLQLVVNRQCTKKTRYADNLVVDIMCHPAETA